jgi:hypothetical protein
VSTHTKGKLINANKPAKMPNHPIGFDSLRIDKLYNIVPMIIKKDPIVTPHLAVKSILKADVFSVSTLNWDELTYSLATQVNAKFPILCMASIMPPIISHKEAINAIVFFLNNIESNKDAVIKRTLEVVSKMSSIICAVELRWIFIKLSLISLVNSVILNFIEIINAINIKITYPIKSKPDNLFNFFISYY